MTEQKMKSFTFALAFLLSQNVAVHSMQTFPLIPHHVQRMRRLEEGRDLSEETKIRQPRRRELMSDIEDGSLRSTQRRASANEVGALYQGYGTHYVDIWCGSPPQRQTVIVDTGSGMTAFPCSGCTRSQCGVPNYHVDELFIEADSSTFKENHCADGCKTSRGTCKGDKCSVSMGYAEGSRWDAYEAIDRCYVGGPHEIPLANEHMGTDQDIDPMHASDNAFDLVFGCQTYLTGLFKTQLADGIMGMDLRPSEAFWGQMWNAGKLADKTFGLCFAKQESAEKKGTESGAMTLGGIDERLHQSPLVYASNNGAGRSGFFNVKVRAIYLRSGDAGTSVEPTIEKPQILKLDISESVLNTGGVIVDSGTTDTYWNRAIHDIFTRVYAQLSGGRQHTNSALSMTEAQMLALPTILFQLEASPDANPNVDPATTPGMAGYMGDPENPNDIIVALPPTHYMEYDPQTHKYTSRFYATENGGSVLGGNTMMGHNVVFDVDNRRIGWAESDCDYTKLVTENGFNFDITGTLVVPAETPAVPAVEPTDPPVTSPTEPPVAPPTEPPVPAPTEPPVPAPTEPPVAAPTEPPVPAPTEPPVPAPTEPPVPAPTEPPVANPVSAPVEAPVEMPVEVPAQPDTATTTPPVTMPASEPDSATKSGGDIDSEESKFQQSLDKAKAFAMDMYDIGKEAVDKFLEVCDSPECRYPVGIGLGVALCAGCCFSYVCSCLYRCFCCCCRKKESGPRYQTLQVDDDDLSDTEVEMVNGKSFSTYKDDPMTGSKTKLGRFRDESSSNGNGVKKSNKSKQRKPEFQGDFI